MRTIATKDVQKRTEMLAAAGSLPSLRLSLRTWESSAQSLNAGHNLLDTSEEEAGMAESTRIEIVCEYRFAGIPALS